MGGVLDSNVNREERNDRWRFHMSMKFEKTDVNVARSRSGCGVSSEAMMGVKNSLTAINFSILISYRDGGTHRIYEVKTTDIRFLGLVEFLDDLAHP